MADVNNSQRTFPGQDHDSCELIDAQNWTDDKISDEMLYSMIDTIKTTVIAPIILGFGLSGNLAFFLLLLRVKKMRTLTDFYLANLAVADVFLLGQKFMHLTSSYQSSILIWNEPFHRNMGCVLNNFACMISCIVSFLFVTFISFDRYFAICRPLQYRIIKNKKYMHLLVVPVIWMISAVFSIPMVLEDGKLVVVCFKWPPRNRYKNFPRIGQYCDLIYPNLEFAHEIMIVFGFALLIVNTILYIKAIRKLMTPMGKVDITPKQNVKQRVTWMLLANCVIFLTCVMATQALLLVAHFSDPSLANEKRLISTAFIIVMVNSSVNPFIYGAASPSYRRGFLRAFGLTTNQIEPSDTQESTKTKISIIVQ